MRVGTYRSKPVEVQAVRLTRENLIATAEWCRGTYTSGTLFLVTPAGALCAELGDWIIRGGKGEFYLYKDDIFKKNYEEI